jgi:dimethylhistidine N-methyltransferase
MSQISARRTTGLPDPSSPYFRDLLAGLQAQPKAVSPKYFYDDAGSALFDEICALPEYYPTRKETALLERHGPEIAARIGPDVDIIEFGAGSVIKIRHLFDTLDRPRRFTPIDISGAHLQASAAILRADYPEIEIRPIVADFTQNLTLPIRDDARRIGFFPGSSIGNFTPAEALAFLTRLTGILRGGGLLIAVDLVKDPAILHAAYNDAAGVTARFNLNLLARANRELGSDFDLDGFAHYAFYHPVLHRIEMHLVSRRAQTVRLGGTTIRFAEGETIHTECSYKYTVPGFQALAREAGFTPAGVWHDGWMSIHWLELPG